MYSYSGIRSIERAPNVPTIYHENVYDEAVNNIGTTMRFTLMTLAIITKPELHQTMSNIPLIFADFSFSWNKLRKFRIGDRGKNLQKTQDIS